MNELSSAVDRSIRDQQLPVTVLPRDLGQWWIDAFFAKHTEPPIGIWWWESLREPVEWTIYDGPDGIALIEGITREWGPSVLIATDEEKEPPAIVLGFPADLVRLVLDLRHFEFVLLDLTAERCLLDTHMNSFAVRVAQQPTVIPAP